MTTTLTERPAGIGPRPLDGVDLGITQRRVFLSEWTKLRSLRSSVYALLVAAVIAIGLGVAVSAAQASHWDHASAIDKLTFDPTAVSLAGLFLAQMAVGVLGVLIITGEYSTGMIRATLGAVPRRLPVLWAKIGVFAGVTFAFMTATSFAAFLAGQAVLSSKGIETTISSPGVLRAVIGGGLYLTVIGILGVALGTLLRSTAGAVASLFGLLLVLPLIVNFLPSTWSDPINKYLPGSAGQAILKVVHDSSSLSPWTGFAVFCGYAAVAVAAAAAVLVRRDA